MEELLMKFLRPSGEGRLGSGVQSGARLAWDVRDGASELVTCYELHDHSKACCQLGVVHGVEVAVKGSGFSVH
jgi:hypothetical protein